jgi:S-adenosylmethionine decarboxylase
MHLAIDGYDADREKLEDPEFVLRFLDEYPSAIGMTKIMPPHVLTYRGPQPEDWGISGFVIIAESHISVHTFPDRRYVNIDIFSCKEFDVEQALDVVKQRFSLELTKSWILERGLEHYTEEKARLTLGLERLSLARQNGS